LLNGARVQEKGIKTMKSRYGILVVALTIGLGWMVLSGSKSFEKIKYLSVNGTIKSEKETKEMFDQSLNDNRVHPIKIPSEMTLANEKVPMTVMDVRERLDRELTVNVFWHSSTILMLKRANRYFPVIEPILQKNGVPDDFKYLALAESGFQNVVSPSGAAGFWQFMKGTATDYKLTLNDEVDERYHLEKSTEAACVYLKKLKEQFGSWTMAAAAYNMGQGALKSQIDKQEQSNYYDLILSDETSRYVFRVLALKAIFTEPEDFGFVLTNADLYQPYEYKNVVVEGPIESWPKFCQQHDITYRQLKLLNPWLREAHLTNTANLAYEIKVMAKNQ
jgi:membrane-bound lytic murein transglycosylase D